MDSAGNLSCLSNNSEIESKVVKNKVKPKRQNFKRNDVKGNQDFKHVISCNENGSNGIFKVLSSNRERIESKHLSLNLRSKGLNFGHFNIQGICGKKCVNFQKLRQF